MTVSWFQIDRATDRLDAPGIERYLIRDPWHDYCTVGQEIRIEFATTDGPVEKCRAVVTGHTPEGSAIVVPLWPPLAVVGDIGSGSSTPDVVVPLPTRPASGSATGGEAS